MRYVCWVFLGLIIVFQAQAFVDIDPESPDAQKIYHLYDIGIITPFEDGGFHSDHIVNKAEGLAMIMKSSYLGLRPHNEFDLTYTDIDQDAWYADILRRALETKVIQDGSANFFPNQPMTRSVFLTSLFRSSQKSIKPYLSRTNNIAYDIPREEWYAPYFAYAKQYQIIPLESDYLYYPDKIITRLEAAQMIYQHLRVLNGDKFHRDLIHLEGNIRQFVSAIESDELFRADQLIGEINQITYNIGRNSSLKNIKTVKYLARSLDHLSRGLLFFQEDLRLSGIAELHLAKKQITNVLKKDDGLKEFAQQIDRIIQSSIYNFL